MVSIPLPTETDLRLSIEQLMAHNNQNQLQSRSYPQTPLQSQVHGIDYVSSVSAGIHSCPYYPQIPHSHSLNTIIGGGSRTGASVVGVAGNRPEYVLSEDFFAGFRYNGAMSNVRRFFCLFITFDLCFTTLLWLICIILNGNNLNTAIKLEIFQYNITRSLFDIVMAAICRFTILLLFYGLLYINHWIIIALSTSGTCAFLIAKVFTFDWHQSTAQPIFPVLLILTSFILAWSETWFLDFKVIPQEWLAKTMFSPSSLLLPQEEERAPLIRSYVEGLHSTVAPTESNFYSPLHSLNPSSSSSNSSVHLDSDQINVQEYKIIESNFQLKSYEFSESEKIKLIGQGKQNLIAAEDRAKCDEWSVLKTNKIGDVIYAIKVPKLGKIYKIKGIINADAHVIFNELSENVNDLHKWNHSLEFSKRIQRINDNTDITYQIAKDTAGGGLVTPRDYVNLRHWSQTNEQSFIISAVSTTHPNLPPRPGYVRGENLLGCWIIKSSTSIDTDHDNENVCCSASASAHFEWILHSPVKVWVPQNFIDNAFSNVMFDFMQNLRHHLNNN